MNKNNLEKLVVQIDEIINKHDIIMKISQDELSQILYEMYMAGVNMTGEYQGCWVRFKDIENIINKHFENKSKEAAVGNEENES